MNFECPDCDTEIVTSEPFPSEVYCCGCGKTWTVENECSYGDGDESYTFWLIPKETYAEDRSKEKE